jgi:hypothetical protein
MFDRSNRTEGPVSVEITLASGRQLSGKFVLPVASHSRGSLLKPARNSDLWKGVNSK